MVFAIITLIFILSTLVLYFLLNIVLSNRIQIINRLDALKKIGQEKKELNELDVHISQRVFIPLKSAIINAASKITPGGIKNKLEQKIAAAGKPLNWGSDQWLLVKLIIGIIIPILLSVGIIIVQKKVTSNGILFILCVVLFFNVLPELLLKQAAEKRKKEIEKDLPDVLDLLTVSVEAGLSFESAVIRLTEKMKGVISDELKRTLNEMKVGKTRREAYSAMSSRCNVSDLSLFISSLIQADELGVGISNVLRVQSEQMRERRRQRVQEKAMKAPIKILFPLIFFIFPTIFVVILGPALIRIMEILGK